MPRYPFAVLIVLGAVPLLRAADFDATKHGNWHHWRGPDANGFVRDATPPTKWDATTNVRWKAELPGRGSATPIVWGDRVFVLTAVKTDRKAKPDELPKPDPRFERKTEPPTHFYRFLVLCFDRDTGKKLWERQAAERVPHEGHHPSHSYAAGSPTTDGRFLYVSFGSFGNYCYDFDGNLKWERDLGRMNTRLGWGEAVTPVIYGGSLLLNYDQEADSKLYCLDAATGKDRWVAKRDEKTTWSTPLVTPFGTRTQVITNGTTQVRSYDLATGRLLWTRPGLTTNPIPSPVRFRDAAVCMAGYRGAAAVSVPLAAAAEAASTRVNWQYASGTPYVPSPALIGDRLYFTQANDALLTILDAATGKPVVDRERLPQGGSFYASPIAAAGRVYFTDRAGTTVVLKAGDELEVVAVNKLGEPVDASPAAVGKQLFLRGDKHLYCIEEK